MRDIKNISLIGLGGVGSTYASKLYDMDPSCLKVITGKERYEKYRKNPFIINGKKYEFNYVLPEDMVEPADLLIISTKYYDLPEVINDIKNHIGENTIILSLLNGILSEEIIGKEYGMEKMLYGMVIGIDAIREKNEVNYAQTATIYFGEEVNNNYSEKVKSVKRLFDKANIKYMIPDDMLRTIWWKFLFNVGINQLSAVLRAPYRVFHKTDEAEQLLRAAMQEVVNIAKKANIDLSEKDIDYFIEFLGTLSPKGKTSMLQDIEAQRKTEVDMLSGTVCDLGRKYNVETPINSMLYLMIKTIEKSYMQKL